MAVFMGRKAMWLVESKTRPYKPHIVVRFGPNNYACGCDANRLCKHIREVTDQVKTKKKAQSKRGK